jgi:hypothetical protein
LAEPLARQILALGRRLADFFRLPANRIFSRKSSPLPFQRREQTQNGGYKRNFRRYPIEFNVSVRFSPGDRPPEKDQGELQDISGGGASFVPCQPGQYYVGQSIETIIYLAGTEEVQGCIRAEATVVRVEPPPKASAGTSARVAVRFERTFDFERMDGGPAGMNE